MCILPQQSQRGIVLCFGEAPRPDVLRVVKAQRLGDNGWVGIPEQTPKLVVGGKGSGSPLISTASALISVARWNSVVRPNGSAGCARYMSTDMTGAAQNPTEKKVRPIDVTVPTILGDARAAYLETIKFSVVRLHAENT